MEGKSVCVVCPKCGFEYLPAEIFYPKDFLGNPDNIVRDEKGKIEFFTGTSINLSEEFTCLNCGCNFSVDGMIKFSAKEAIKNDFDDDHVTIIYKDRAVLEEN